MKVYHYSKQTKEFIKESISREDPLEEGKFLVPASSTTKEPLIASKNESCVFENDEWKVKSDFRGVVYYDEGGKEYIITSIGETKPEWALDTKPTFFNLAQKKIEKKAELRQAYIDNLIKMQLDAVNNATTEEELNNIIED